MFCRIDKIAISVAHDTVLQTYLYPWFIIFLVFLLFVTRNSIRSLVKVTFRLAIVIFIVLFSIIFFLFFVGLSDLDLGLVDILLLCLIYTFVF